MYFEEPWFVDLNFRLNSFQNRIATMTSASVQSDNVDDFEEGEILDDDDDIPLPAQDVYKSVDSNLNIQTAYGRKNITRHSDSLLTEPPFRSKPNHHPRSKSRGRDSPDRNLKATLIKRLRRSLQNRKRASNARNEVPLARRAFRLSRPNTYRNERSSGIVQDRTRAGTPYEEKLREFQQRTRRLRSNSVTPERRLPRPKNCTNPARTKNCSSPPRTKQGTSPLGTKKSTCPTRDKNGSSPLRIKKGTSPTTTNNSSPARTKSIAKQLKITNAGTSLLQRLVGSGSVDSKLLEDNVISELKCSTNSTEIIQSPAKETPVPDDIEVSVTNSPLVSNVPIIVQAQVIFETENNGTKKESNEYVNENTCDSSTFRMDLDTDLLELRMAALKTAVVKNHNKRTSKGYVPKKTVNKVDDPIIDSFMEIESLLVSDTIGASPDPTYPQDKILEDEFGNVNSDHSDMCLDSNNSDEDAAHQNTSPAEMRNTKEENISSLKRSNSNSDLHSEDSLGTKKLKLEDHSQENQLVQDSIISDLNEELELRDLALRSFFGRSRKSPKSSEIDSDEVNSKTEITDSSPFDEIEAKSKGDERKRNDSDNWEELDEDILRAHLLKTLSASLPERSMPDEDTEKSNSSGQHVYKPTCSLFQKKEPNPELDMQSKLWSELMVPKLVISLGSDSESESESSIDFVKSLDLLLQEAKEKSEKTTPKEEPKPKVKKKAPSPKQSLKKPILKKGVSSTPVAVRHLPIQQQEEYRRLKIKLEKLKLNKSKGSTDVSPTVSRTESPVPASKPQIQNVVIPTANKSSTNLTLKQKQITVTSKSKTKIINRVEPILKKSNVPLVGAKTEVDGAVKSKLLKTSNLGSKVINRLTPGINVKNNLLLVNKPGTNVKSKIPANLPNISKSRTKLVNPIKSDLNKVTSKVMSPTLKIMSPAPKVKADLPSNIIDKTKINKNLLSKEDSKSNSECSNKSELLPSSTEKPDATSENKLVNSVDGKFLFNFNVETPKKETVIQNEKDKSMVNSKQNSLSSVSKCNRVLPGVETKDNEGNSDKENEVVKSVFVGRAERDQEILERLSYVECKMSDEDLSEKLKDAESKYEETLNLVSQLEKELEDAKKMLTERAHAVAVLKELSVKGLIDVATLCVKNPDNESASGKAGEPASETDLNSENTECCWDPDGVLCPFQLAGCCKDPSCSFHHIRS